MIAVIRGENELVSGLKEALKVAAAGRRHLEGIGYSLHMATEGRHQSEVNHNLKIADSICQRRNGKEIIASVPRVMRSVPFPPPYMLLGPEGERWVPMHGIVPHSRHEKALNMIDDFMNKADECCRRT